MKNHELTPAATANAADANIILRKPDTNDSAIATLIFSSVAESVFGGTSRAASFTRFWRFSAEGEELRLADVKQIFVQIRDQLAL